MIFARSLLLIDDGAGGFPSAFALNGSARAMKPREVSVRPTGMCSDPA